MVEKFYKYIIVGAGLAGASAVDGIREIDKNGSILLIGKERHLPYHRPPLSKKLWTGDDKVENIYVHDKEIYRHRIKILLQTTAKKIDCANKSVFCSDGEYYFYEKLLLATGAEPKKLQIPGAESNGIYYYYNLDDFLTLRNSISKDSSVAIIGGGFIGSEMAASLVSHQIKVTMIFPDKYLVQRVFPEALGQHITKTFREKGVNIITEDFPTEIQKQENNKYVIHTDKGQKIICDLMIVGIGINPAVEICENTDILVQNGIQVDELLQTSHRDVFAAGDNVIFPYLDKKIRYQHWDNALNQGKQAGRNMAGANETYSYQPFFFSDLFDFSYEAVGEINSKMDIFYDWETEFKRGIIYYIQDGKVCGVMACNVWNKMSFARDIILSQKIITDESLRGLIKFITKKQNFKFKEKKLPLSDDKVRELSSVIPDWKQVNGNLERAFEFKNFNAALSFVNEVATIAENAHHHPDIHIFYNKVVLDLMTHEIGGITEKDVEVAKKISQYGKAS